MQPKQLARVGYPMSSIFGRSTPPRVPTPRPDEAPTKKQKKVHDVASAQGEVVEIPDTRDIQSLSTCMVPYFFAQQGGKPSEFSTGTLVHLKNAIDAARAGEKPPHVSSIDCVEFLQAAELLCMPAEGKAAFEDFKTELKTADAIWSQLERAMGSWGENADRATSLALNAAFADFDAFRADPRWAKHTATDEGYARLRDLCVSALDDRLTDYNKEHYNMSGGYKGAEDALLWLIDENGLENVQEALNVPSIETACRHDLSKLLTWYFNHPAWERQSQWPLVRHVGLNRGALAEKLLNMSPPRDALLVLLPHVSEEAISAWAKKDVSVIGQYARRGDLATIKEFIAPSLPKDTLDQWLDDENTPYTEAVEHAQHETISYFHGLTQPWRLEYAIRDSSYLQKALIRASDETWAAMFPNSKNGHNEALKSLRNDDLCEWLENAYDMHGGYQEVARLYKRILSLPSKRNEYYSSRNGAHYSCYDDFLGFRAAIATGDTQLAERILTSDRIYSHDEAYRARDYGAFHSAIAAGHLHVLTWLKERDVTRFGSMLSSDSHYALRLAASTNQTAMVDFITAEPNYLEKFVADIERHGSGGELASMFKEIAERGHVTMFERMFVGLSEEQQRTLLTRHNFDLAHTAAYRANNGVWPILYRLASALGVRDDMLKNPDADVLWTLAEHAPTQFMEVIDDIGPQVVEDMRASGLWKLRWVVQSTQASSDVFETLLAPWVIG